MAKTTARPIKENQTSSSKTSMGSSFKLPLSKNKELLFDKTNYILMGLGFIVIIIGFILMSGGGSKDPNIFNEAEIYSFRRITLAPIVVIIGFLIEVVAILKRPSEVTVS